MKMSSFPTPLYPLLEVFPEPQCSSPNRPTNKKADLFQAGINLYLPELVCALWEL